MRRIVKALALLVCGVLFPAAAFAQAGITGNVRDASGAVLPGVTVEASSPALIEKTRSVVTDGGGNYRIEDLRPGSYAVTFTLPGFSTVKRDGVELTGSFVASINAELRVGSIEETITVTGQTPQVDVSSSTRQRVLNEEVLKAIPTGRSYYSVANLIPGLSGNNANDPGAVGGGGMTTLAIHGGRPQDMRVRANGLSFTQSLQDGTSGGNIPNQSAVQEFAVDTDGHTAEYDTSGVQINIIFKEGGNAFSSYNFFTWGGEQTAANNLTDRLRRGPYGRAGLTDAPGLQRVNSTKSTWEINPSIGGPIVRDKLWFHYAFRYQRSEMWSAGMYYNKNAFDPAKWTYDPDPDRLMLSRDAWYDSSQIRLTWQATAKNKVAFAWDLQNSCECPSYQNATVSPPPLVAPESASDRRFPHEQTYRAEWTSPVNDRMLLEFKGQRRTETWGLMHLRPSGTSKMWPFRGGSFDRTFPMSAYPTYFGLNAVVEQNSVNGMLPGLVYRGPQNTDGGPAFGYFTNTDPPGWYTQGATSYVTGSHAFKVGFTTMIGYVDASFYTVPGSSLKIRARSPVDANGRILAPDGLPTPNQITLYAGRRVQTNLDCQCSIFAQDKWTLDRWTFNYGIRYDWFHNSYPDATLAADPLFIGTSFARGVDQELKGYDNVFWKDIVPRFGAAWDVNGDGRTAVKLSAGKFLQSMAASSFTETNPVSRLVNSASRGWTDANRNMAIDCDYLNPAANGECAAFTGPFVNFGTLTPNALPNDSFRKGWDIRPWNWHFSAGIQRELLPGVSGDISYFRRVNGNFTTVLYNQAYDTTCGTPGDHRACFTEFGLIAPTDSRLGDTSGATIGGNYDVLPQFAALAPRNLTALVKALPGSPTQRQHWNGFDVSVNARLPRGVILQAGTSTGSTMFDNCELVQRLPETRGTTPAEYCHYNTPWKTHFKGFGSYTLPKIDVQVAGFFQSFPEVNTNLRTAGPREAMFILSNANLATNSTLARPLTAAGGQQTINLLNPGTSIYQERVTQLDLRMGKIIRQGQYRYNLSMDIFNVFNADTITQESNAYDTLWRPANVLQARFAKFTVQFEF